jgi:sarcosine oxidase subunit alpha
VFTTADSGWTTAQDLAAAGVDVTVVDPRSHLPPVAEDLVRNGCRIFSGAVIADVHGSPVKSADIVGADGRKARIAADFVAMAGGWNPVIGLSSNLGARPVWSERISSFVMDQGPAGLAAAGAAAGDLGLATALAGGVREAQEAIADLGFPAKAQEIWRASDEPSSITPLWHVSQRRKKAFVDFQHDVTDKDIELAAHEGFQSIEHLKRYTTLGMATDQGKTSQVNGHALLAAATGKSIAEAGTILSRPPFLPISIGVLAGHHRDGHFRPVRRTAGHDWAIEQNATFVDVGLWKRAQWFSRTGEKSWLETVNREVSATRNGVGICDVSTLGKIDVHGPDAGILLDRLYTNMFSTLPVGKARYGVMLREDGIVMDDGTTTRLSQDHYYVTTTTANAARVMQHIDYARQVLWPELDVQATSVTEQWSTYSVAGPHARALLQQAFPELDVSNDAIPFMGAREFAWDGATARIFRLSFSGEMAYEVSVPASRGDRLVRMLFEIGKAYDATPYGTEALGVMRIEKGHPAGNELNGMTTAADLGMGRMMSTKKDFIGRIMAGRPGLADPTRPRLVGLRPVDPSHILRAGGHLVPMGLAPVAANDDGYVTSAAFSPTLGHSIALGLLRNGEERHGEIIKVHDPVRNADIAAVVCNPVFVDPEGARVRG